MTSPLPSLSSPSPPPPPPPPPLSRGRRKRGRGWSGLTSISEYRKRVSEVTSLHNAHQQDPIATTASVLLLHFCSLSRAQRNGECVSVSLAAGKGLLRECTPVGAHQHDSEEQRGSLHLLPGTPQGGMRLWATPVNLFQSSPLSQCIREMEGVVRSCPPSSLQPALLTNLTATYDLESSSSHSKKLSFLPLLGQHVGEGFPLSSLGLR